MPMRERSFDRLVSLAGPIAVDSHVACAKRSSPLRIDQRAFARAGRSAPTTIALETSVVQFFSTWKLPYNLLTFFISIIEDMADLKDDGHFGLQALHDEGERQ